MKLRVFIGNLNLGNCELGDMEYGIYKYRSIFLFWSSNFISATNQMLEIENMYLFSNISLTLRFEDGVIEFGAKFTIQWCFYNDDINDLIFFFTFL